ncbi:hypothetical protein SteCoe_14830 [Stentor coeruleus]|uniref:dual-specificity kinase n=1 Tax=Stentor coeruleus TaxID=5963 RepID=A0A1R2C536_9CILI|nr:hypothetical protein SteCoe_14830 [Stentor coeruleus]
MMEGEVINFKRPYVLSSTRTRVMQSLKKDPLILTPFDIPKANRKALIKFEAPIPLDKKSIVIPLNPTNIKASPCTNSPKSSPHKSHHSRTSSQQIQISSFIQTKKMTPSEVLTNFPYHLTDFEKNEIKNYNFSYFIGQDAVKQKSIFTDASGNYIIKPKDHIFYRYEIIQLLGSGSYSQVLKCYDHKKNQHVAIKILKLQPKYRESGEIEYNILNLLNNNTKNETNIIKVYKKLVFRKHLIIVSELLHQNLYQFIESYDFKPININIVKRITTQLLIALNHIHSNNIIHCDLNPENILLKNSNKSSIRVIDFCNACFKNYYPNNCIQSLYYSAPEKLFKLDYDEKIDIWSLGCIVYELITGAVLFNGKNEHEQMIKIVSVIGFPSLPVIDKIKKKYKDFNIQAFKGIPKVSLRKILTNYDINIVEFIEDCLNWDYEVRISASEGLRSSWIKGHRRSLSETPRMINNILM